MDSLTAKKRDVDWVIEFIKESTRIDPVVKKALTNRLIPRLTRDEIDTARYQMHKDDD